MHGGRKLEIEICGVKSSGRSRHTRGCSDVDEVVDNTISALIRVPPATVSQINISFFFADVNLNLLIQKCWPKADALTRRPYDTSIFYLVAAHFAAFYEQMHFYQQVSHGFFF